VLEAVGGMNGSEDISTKFAVGCEVVVGEAGGETTDEECVGFGVVVEVGQFQSDMLGGGCFSLWLGSRWHLR
jgi:hypothetical protein